MTKQSEQYKTLSLAFLKAMDEIGVYGLEKYAERSIAARIERGDFSRCERTKARKIVKHAANHGEEYLDGVLHDKFKTRRHQLAAGAYNYMMEFMLAGLDSEG